MRKAAITPVVLGLVGLGARSGYDIKSAVDGSARFFWAGSYGQIYPELRRLEDEGLIRGEDAPNGARGRRVYELTDAGRKWLVDWLVGPETTIEYRDESLLRLFFADALPREDALGVLEARKRGHEQYLEILRAIESRAGGDPDFMNLVLRWGIEFNEWGVEWCERHLQRLRRSKAA
jgi:DNA-binding PadR family transcriptional regulator